MCENLKVCKGDQLSPETTLLLNYTQARIHCNDNFYDFDVNRTIFDPEWKSTFEKYLTVFWTGEKLATLSQKMEKVSDEVNLLSHRKTLDDFNPAK